MKKILLCILLIFLFPGNIIIQGGAIAAIIILFIQTVKKKSKNYLKNESKKTIELNKDNINSDQKSKGQDLNYLRELRYEITRTQPKENPKTYKKSKV